MYHVHQLDYDRETGTIGTEVCFMANIDIRSNAVQIAERYMDLYEGEFDFVVVEATACQLASDTAPGVAQNATPKR